MSDGCTGIAKLHHCNWKILALEKLALLQHEICGPIWATAVETHLSNCDGESEGYSIFGRTGYSEWWFEFVLRRESSLSDEHVKCSVSGLCSVSVCSRFLRSHASSQESVHKHCGTDGIRLWPEINWRDATCTRWFSLASEYLKLRSCADADSCYVEGPIFSSPFVQTQFKHGFSFFFGNLYSKFTIRQR
jgi:hypothetical protein